MMFQVAGGIIIAVGVLGFLATIGEAIDRALAPGRHAREQRRIQKWRDNEAAHREWLIEQWKRCNHGQLPTWAIPNIAPAPPAHR